MNLPRTRGFTLIELLVVIAIIGILSSVVLASLNTARSKAADAQRLSNIREVQKALEMYASSNSGQYPSTGGSWRSTCSSWGSYANSAVIPNLSPAFIGQVPTDPQVSLSGNTCCYLYNSDGKDYIFMDFNCPTSKSCSGSTVPSAFQYPTYPTLACAAYTSTTLW